MEVQAVSSKSIMVLARIADPGADYCLALGAEGHATTDQEHRQIMARHHHIARATTPKINMRQARAFPVRSTRQIQCRAYAFEVIPAIENRMKIDQWLRSAISLR